MSSSDSPFCLKSAARRRNCFEFLLFAIMIQKESNESAVDHRTRHSATISGIATAFEMRVTLSRSYRYGFSRRMLSDRRMAALLIARCARSGVLSLRFVFRHRRSTDAQESVYGSSCCDQVAATAVILINQKLNSRSAECRSPAKRGSCARFERRRRPVQIFQNQPLRSNAGPRSRHTLAACQLQSGRPASGHSETSSRNGA